MCKPKICKTISGVNQNEPNVNFSPPYANHKILVIPKSFTKSLRVTAYFYGLITCPTFLVQSGEVTFLGEKKVYMVYTGLHRFTSVCPPMFESHRRINRDRLWKQRYSCQCSIRVSLCESCLDCISDLFKLRDISTKGQCSSDPSWAQFRLSSFP